MIPNTTRIFSLSLGEIAQHLITRPHTPHDITIIFSHVTSHSCNKCQSYGIQKHIQ